MADQQAERMKAAGREEPVEDDPEAEANESGADDEGVVGAEVDPAEMLEEDLTALMERLQTAEQAAAENHDRFLRTLAEFDTFRRRTRQEMEDARRQAIEKLAADLLPVLDNFERALLHSGDGKEDPVREGVLLTHKQLADVLARHEIQPIEALGRPFDPHLHEAIMRVDPGPEHEPGTVVEELRKGYTIGGRVLRASLVKVAGE
jgi:molecular chaperone GrpE